MKFSDQVVAAEEKKYEADEAARAVKARRDHVNSRFNDLLGEIGFREWVLAKWSEYVKATRTNTVAHSTPVKPEECAGINSVAVGGSTEALVQANQALNRAIAYLGNLDGVGQPFPVRDGVMAARRLCLDAIGYVEGLHKEMTRGK